MKRSINSQLFGAGGFGIAVLSFSRDHMPGWKLAYAGCFSLKLFFVIETFLSREACLKLRLERFTDGGGGGEEQNLY